MNNGLMKEAVKAGVFPPIDDVVQWLAEELADFATFRSEHRQLFYDKVSRSCRSNASASHILKGIMPWIRVIADHEARLRIVETHEDDQNGMADEENHAIADLLKRVKALEKKAAKPKAKRGRPKKKVVTPPEEVTNDADRPQG